MRDVQRCSCPEPWLLACTRRRPITILLTRHVGGSAAFGAAGAERLFLAGAFNFKSVCGWIVWVTSAWLICDSKTLTRRRDCATGRKPRDYVTAPNKLEFEAQIHCGDWLRAWAHCLVSVVFKGDEETVKIKKGKKAWAGLRLKDTEEIACVSLGVTPEEGVKKRRRFDGRKLEYSRED